MDKTYPRRMYLVRMRFLAVALLLIAAPPLTAQFTWGAELGANLSTYGGLDAQSSGVQTRIGPHVGLTAIRQMRGGRVFARSGVAYSQRGAGFEVAGYSSRMRFGYVDIPASVG